MLESSQRRIEETLPDDALIIDVGGGIETFARADYVLDILPYQEPRQADTSRRWGRDTWIVQDICAREPWPFEDDRFDFVTCAQTLEDIRDPIWVCQEMQRVAKAGYIEVPSLQLELTWLVNGPWVGYSHHRWLVDVREDGIDFVIKGHAIHRVGAHLRTPRPEGDAAASTFWWEGSFPVRERVITAAEQFDDFVREIVGGPPLGPYKPSKLDALRHRVARARGRV